MNSTPPSRQYARPVADMVTQLRSRFSSDEIERLVRLLRELSPEQPAPNECLRHPAPRLLQVLRQPAESLSQPILVTLRS
jgi:hypothetical protein